MSEAVPVEDEASEPDAGALALKIAHVMEQRGDLRGAKEAYRFALSELANGSQSANKASSAAEAALGQGRVAETMGNLPEARRAFLSAAQIATHDTTAAAEAALGQGRVAETMGDLPEAREAFLRAADIAQDNPTVAGGAWLGVAGLAQQMGDLPEAREAFLRAADIAQDNPTVAGGAWLGVAGLAQQMGDLLEAREAFLRAADIAQGNPTEAAGAWLGAAAIAERMGDLPEAREAFLRAADIAQGNPTEAAGAWLGVATIAERMGDLPEARQAYNRVIEISPQNQAQLVWLSIQRLSHVLERMGYSTTEAKDSDSARAAAAWIDSSRSDAARMHYQADAIQSEARRLFEQLSTPRRPTWMPAAWHFRNEGRNRPLSFHLMDEDVHGLRNRLVLDQDLNLRADIHALTLDQAALEQDLRHAVIKLLATDQPRVLAVLFIESIGQQSRTDVQNAAKMVRTFKVNEAEVTKLVADLGRLHSHQPPSGEKGSGT